MVSIVRMHTEHPQPDDVVADAEALLLLVQQSVPPDQALAIKALLSGWLYYAAEHTGRALAAVAAGDGNAGAVLTGTYAELLRSALMWEPEAGALKDEDVDGQGLCSAALRLYSRFVESHNVEIERCGDVMESALAL